MFSIKRLKEILNMLPKEVNPRIGGSCALYFYGIVDTYRDVDIIVDSIDGIDLPFPRIELNYPKKLNKGIKYYIGSEEVNILEKLSYVSVIVHSTISGLAFEDIDEIYRAKKLINEFIETKYGKANSTRNL